MQKSMLNEEVEIADEDDELLSPRIATAEPPPPSVRKSQGLSSKSEIYQPRPKVSGDANAQKGGSTENGVTHSVKLAIDTASSGIGTAPLESPKSTTPISPSITRALAMAIDLSCAAGTVSPPLSPISSPPDARVSPNVPSRNSLPVVASPREDRPPLNRTKNSTFLNTSHDLASQKAPATPRAKEPELTLNAPKHAAPLDPESPRLLLARSLTDSQMLSKRDLPTISPQARAQMQAAVQKTTAVAKLKDFVENESQPLSRFDSRLSVIKSPPKYPTHPSILNI